jgi:phosphoglycerol transferase MdoB-like AlkP superfamily enzyme
VINSTRSVPARLFALGLGMFFVTSLAARIILLVTARHHLTINLSLAGAFVSGVGYDFAAGVFAGLPWLLLGVLIPPRALASRPGRWLIAGLMWMFASVLIFITAAEWFFWDEFSARFNFIAVDYLIWTQEVWGNISESYPIVPIFIGIGLLAAALTWLLQRRGVLAWPLRGGSAGQQRGAALVGGVALAALVAAGVRESFIPEFTNPYHYELAKNGPWSFFAAFRQMELSYTKWYLTIPADQMRSEVKQLLGTPNEQAASPSNNDLSRTIKSTEPEKKWNVITICMESMSGEYLSYLGNKQGLTPNLDRLANESIFFENLYATGTRTVRGMEALTLSLPPTPGQAIIYRPEGTNLTTTFTPFLDRGYDCAFFYGGDGRFDFMNRYFGTNGCRIMDVGAWDARDITFKTAWGACDEDLFHKTLREADAAQVRGTPFHYFCMTTSNHRPYDFPYGRIDSPPHKRKSAVKYADWALGDFINEAKKHSWFKDTLFVIVADHCASSAGKNELDVTKYHIPAMIYNPSLLPAQTLSQMSSQIDVMPTVFGLMHWSYQTLGYGHDLLAPGATSRPGRAFVSNYQKIALLRDDRIAILKPNQLASAYACDPRTGELGPLRTEVAAPLVHEAGVFYQSASWLFGSGGLKRPPAAK